MHTVSLTYHIDFNFRRDGGGLGGEGGGVTLIVWLLWDDSWKDERIASEPTFATTRGCDTCFSSNVVHSLKSYTERIRLVEQRKKKH